MTIAEPATVLTDGALAGVAGWLAWSLSRACEGQWARWLWGLAFIALALAAALGGIWHAFAPGLAPIAALGIWKATVLSVGIASFAMLAASAFAATAGGVRKALLAVAAVKLAISSAWMVGHDEYISVIADTGAALGLVALLSLQSVGRQPASLWILVGVGVSALAAAAQASGFSLHRHFNHNDLYHVIQIAAMILFYAGARRLRDRDEPARSP